MYPLLYYDFLYVAATDRHEGERGGWKRTRTTVTGMKNVVYLRD